MILTIKRIVLLIECFNNIAAIILLKNWKLFTLNLEITCITASFQLPLHKCLYLMKWILDIYLYYHRIVDIPNILVIFAEKFLVNNENQISFILFSNAIEYSIITKNKIVRLLVSFLLFR